MTKKREQMKTGEMQIQYVPIDSLGPASWRANYVLAPDLRLLKNSLLDGGWIYPIVAQLGTGIVIDGWHRLRVHQKTAEIKQKWGLEVPVIWMDVDDIDARVWHVRLNRARGSIVAKSLSRIVRDLMDSKKYDQYEICAMLEMTDDEIDLLVDGGDLLKIRKVREHKYSPGWVPIEAPAGTVVAPEITIERPPTKDR